MENSRDHASVVEGEGESNLADKIRKKLLVDESALLDRLIDDSARYIQLDSSGKVHFKHLDALRGIDAAAIFLLGKRLARDAGLSPEDTVDAQECAIATGMKKQVAAARLHDLLSEGKAESPERGKYRVVIARAHTILGDAAVNTKIVEV